MNRTSKRAFGKRLALAFSALALIGAAGALSASPAQARPHFGVYVGVPLYAPGPYYYAPAPAYYYTAPPAYYYTAPPVVYTATPTAAPLPVTPTSAPYVAPDGRTCETYSGTAMVNGVATGSTGVACLGADGLYHIAR